MRQLLHACWPLMAVMAFTAVLALQIPRKALFFKPAPTVPATPFASFVEFDGAAYSSLMQKVRMSWQMRTQGTGLRTESPLGVLDLVQTPARPEPLALPAAFFEARPVAARPAARVPLLPPTLASAVGGSVQMPADDRAARRLRERLLAIPASIHFETEIPDLK